MSFIPCSEFYSSIQNCTNGRPQPASKINNGSEASLPGKSGARRQDRGAKEKRREGDNSVERGGGCGDGGTGSEGQQLAPAPPCPPSPLLGHQVSPRQTSANRRHPRLHYNVLNHHTSSTTTPVLHSHSEPTNTSVSTCPPQSIEDEPSSVPPVPFPRPDVTGGTVGTKRPRHHDCVCSTASH